MKPATIILMILLMTGCGPGGKKKAYDPSAGTGPFDWKMAAGQTISLHLNKHPFTQSLLPRLEEFTQLTGIRVEYSILSEEEFRDKLIIELSSGSGSVDVFMTGPLTAWSYHRAGWIETLDPYLGNPSLTSPEYDPEDFYPSLMEANRWNKKPGMQNYGKGDLLAIPVQVETYVLCYRKDWAGKLGLETPETYPEYFRFIDQLTHTEGGTEYLGVTARGLGTWPTVTTGYLSGFASYGCRDFDEQMNCRINSPRAVEFTDKWIRSIRENGPAAWTNNKWYDAKEQFESGRYGSYFDAGIFAYSYENPDKSLIAGKVQYALPPAGPGGSVVSNFWTWSLSINQKSRHKAASWLFIQWATSRERLLDASLNGNWNPSRKSVWNNPQVIEMTRDWDNYRNVVQENLQEHARICWTPHADIPAMGDRWARALQEIWSGKDAGDALDRAARHIDRIIERAGSKPE